MARRKYKNHYLRIASLLLLAVLIVGLVNYLRPLPAAKAQQIVPVSEVAQPVSLPWPAYGQAALSASGYGLLATHSSTKPVPVGSVAKVITALTVLSKKPLSSGATGPTITLTQADVDNYNQYVSQDGSVVPVAAGEQISERQALEAMLLPSADNMADSLAAWAFGSLSVYSSFANQYIKTLGLNHTTVADASGFSPQTVSTAADLVQLGSKALADPTVSTIVAERQASLPVADTISNINWLLNSDGFVGIKTGSTDQAGGCFLFAVHRTISGQNLTLIGAVLGAPNLYTSMLDSRTLADAAPAGFKQTTLVSSGQAVATYKTKWNTTINAVAASSVSALVWHGQVIKFGTDIEKLPAGARAGTVVGKLNVSLGGHIFQTELATATANQKPSAFWRLTR
jgi:serine-type D-Ala-D-Ala carboxypeptidase (penicillin-binding protein 5/6)